jgi:hypothetical protein
MRYYVINEEYIMEFMESAQKMINNGWKPQGGVSVSVVGFATYYAQAFIKEVRE